MSESTKLAVREDQPPQHGMNLLDMAKQMIAAGIAPRGLDTPQKLAIVMQAGAELGIAPFVAVRSFYVTNGRPSLFGDLPMALVLNSGLLEDYEQRVDVVPGKTPEERDMIATVTVKRKGVKTAFVGKFSWQDAKRAGLTGSGTYQHYPQRMILWRAKQFALRDAFPDVLLNVVDDMDDTAVPGVSIGSGTPTPATETEALNKELFIEQEAA